MKLITMIAALVFAAVVPAAALAQGEDGNVPPSGVSNNIYTPDPIGAAGGRQYAEAMTAIQAKDFARAERLADAVRKDAPGDVNANKLLGAAQIGGGNWRGAARTYATVVKLEPTDPVGHAGLGVALAMLKDAKAQGQLSWLTARIEKCAGRCPDAGRLAALAGRVRTALGSTSGGSQ